MKPEERATRVVQVRFTQAEYDQLLARKGYRQNANRIHLRAGRLPQQAASLEASAHDVSRYTFVISAGNQKRCLADRCQHQSGCQAYQQQHGLPWPATRSQQDG